MSFFLGNTMMSFFLCVCVTKYVRVQYLHVWHDWYDWYDTMTDMIRSGTFSRIVAAGWGRRCRVHDCGARRLAWHWARTIPRSARYDTNGTSGCFYFTDQFLDLSHILFLSTSFLIWSIYFLWRSVQISFLNYVILHLHTFVYHHALDATISFVMRSACRISSGRSETGLGIVRRYLRHDGSIA